MLEIGVATKINLLLFTISSFIPQLNRLHVPQNYKGISFIYVFLNLVLATEELALGIAFAVTASLNNGGLSLGDCLDIAQFGVIWLYHIALFLTCYQLEPIQTAPKTALLMLYAFHFVSSLGVVMLGLTIQDSLGKEIFIDYYFGYHIMFANPVVTIAGLASVGFQARETLSRRSLGALSLSGLAMQASIFMLVGLAWLSRLQGTSVFASDPVGWFLFGGWTVVDNLVFAFVQAILFCIAWMRRENRQVTDETSPLLQEH